MGKKKIELPNIGFTWKKIKGFLGKSSQSPRAANSYYCQQFQMLLEMVFILQITMNETKIALS